MSTDFNVAIIGAGQAGLATSWHLKQLDVDHVVVESGRVAETWRSRRWDSFCLVTPNWTVRVPGGEYTQSDPDGFMGRDQLVAHLQRWSDSFAAPVRGDCPVSALDHDGDRFVLSIPNGSLQARTVVVATGAYQRAYRPPHAATMPAGVKQLLAEEYANPHALPDGAVLIVGGGQTGFQLAEELHESGRKVFLSCGRAPWAPRRMGGRDLVRWMVDCGWWQRTLADLPSPMARLISNPLTTGRAGGHDLHYRTLHEKGVELVGRYVGADDGSAHFADDLAQSADAGDAMASVLKRYIDTYCEREGIPSPWQMPPPFRVKARTELDLARNNVNSVIWTAGFRPDYGWVHADVFDDMGFPVQHDGRSAVPGLYFMGLHFQRKGQSSVFYGVGEDAEIVASHIKENRA